MSFYADEHIARAVVRGLRERGVDGLTVAEAGLRGAADEAHLERARRAGRVIVTQDEDFLRLHAAGAAHTGIVYAAQHVSIGELVCGLMLLVQVLDAEEMRGQVEYL